MEEAKKGFRGVLGLDPSLNSQQQPEYLVMSHSMQWALLFLAGLQSVIHDATTLRPEDMTSDSARVRMTELLSRSPVKVSLDRVDAGMLKKEQSAIVLSTELHPTRRLWVTYDKLKRPESEKWDQFLVVMFANHEQHDPDFHAQEGILHRYPIIPREERTKVWMMDIAKDVLLKLYTAGLLEPLKE